MNKLALVSMAAIAASLPGLAAAQGQAVAPPVAWEEVPQVGLRAPAAPAAGVTWQNRARSTAPQLAPTQAAAVQAAPAAAAIVRQAARAGDGHRMGRMGGHRMGKAGGHRMGRIGGHRMGKAGGHRMGRVGGHHIGKGGHRMGRFGEHHKGKRFDHIRRIHRGGRVHGFFWGPQFHVRNWGLYGFPEPIHDRRWVRYYDDAYLIDGDGRVHDSRYGLDWDEYGERWDYDERGIPAYGDDAHEGEEDYAWDGEAEDEYSDWDEGRDRGEHHGGYHKHGGGHAYQGGSCTVTYSFNGSHPAPPPPPPPPGCGHGGGYGYGYGPGVVVTETIVTTHPVVTEEVVRVRKHKRHHGKYRPRHAPPPPPPEPEPEPGERG